MAENKYVDLSGLTYYDEKIKDLIAAQDADTLAAAKKYCDDKDELFESAGAAATVQSNLDAEITRAKAAEEANATAAANAKTAADNAQTAANNAQAAADAAQSDVNALETYVGTIPEGASSTNIVDYIAEKTNGIATDTALAELQAQVSTNKSDIATIKSDYLKSADKTALQNNIDDVGAKVTTLIGSDNNKSVRTIANEELAAQLIPENAKESLNTLTEIANWIQSHPDDASAMNTAITALQNLVGTIPTEDVTATTIVGYIQELVDAEKNRATGVESGIDTRVAAIETKLTGTGDGSVADQIADAVADEAALREAADTALDGKITTAQNTANTAKSKVEALETTVSTLSDVVDTKAAASDLTALTTRVTTAEGDIDALQAAIAEGGSVTLAIADAKKAGTDAQADVDALEAIVSGHTTTIGSHGDRISALETKVGDGFVAITSAEIDNLFTT